MSDLKDLLKLPFEVFEEDNGGFVICDNERRIIFRVASRFYVGKCELELAEFASAALNEKTERDYCKPMNWELVSKGAISMVADEYKCPKCKKSIYIYEGNSIDFRCCPYCKQNLIPPGAEYLISETIDGVKTGLIIPEDRITNLSKGDEG